MSASKTEEVKKELQQLLQGVTSSRQLMSEVVELLHERMLKYNWVGFYMLEPESGGQPPMLVLGAFQGAMTPHTRIPLNQGICGRLPPAARPLLWMMSARMTATSHARSRPNRKS